MISMQVSYENRREPAGSQAGAHYLVLRSLPAIEEHPFILTHHSQCAHVALERRLAGTGAKENRFHQGKIT